MTSRIALLTLLVTACEASPSQRSDPSRDASSSSNDAAVLTTRRRPEAPMLTATLPVPEASAQVVATLSACNSVGCPLTLTFDRPMGPPGSLPTPEALGCRVTADGPSELSWRSPTELLITPKPGSFQYGQTIQVAVDSIGFSGEATVPFFVAAGKTAAWPVTLGAPRLVDLLDDHLRQVGRGPVYLLYDQPVTLTAKLRAGFRAANSSGEPLMIRVFRPEDVSRVTDEIIPLENVLAVRFPRLPANGEKIELRYPTQGDGGSTSEVVELTVASETSMLVSESEGSSFDPAQTHWLIPISANLTFNFAAPVRRKVFEGALSIEPTPVAQQVDSNGNVAWVSLTLEPGKSYRVRIDSTLTDILGNSIGKADLRLRARDLPPALELPNGPTVALERGRARLSAKVTNLEKLTPEVALVEPIAFMNAIASGSFDCGAFGTLITLPTSRVTLPMNETGTIELPIDLGARRQSQLCVRLRGTGRGSEASEEVITSALVQSSGLAITTKLSPRGGIVFVTRLSDAKPIRGARVELRTADGQPLRSDLRTGADGVTKVDFPQNEPMGELFVVARFGDDTAIAHVSDAELSSPWQFGLPSDSPTLEAAIFTDRGVYRPGETVELKVIARPDGKTPVTKQAHVLVRDSRGQTVDERDLPLDRFGAADQSLSLSNSAPVGAYSVDVTVDGMTARRSFRVEEYRVPTFKVSVELPDPLLLGPAAATIKGAYLFGGPLSERQVRWQIAREPAPFSPSGFPEYLFGGTPSGPGQSSPPQTSLVGNGEGRLSSDGTQRVNLEVEASGRPYRYTAEASVTDLDRQTWAGRASRVVHGADLYVGLRPPKRGVLEAGDPIEVEVATVRSSGEPISATAQVSLRRIDNHTVVRGLGTGATELSSRPIGVDVGSCTVTTDATGRGTCSLSSTEPGAFEVSASVRDDKGRASTSVYALAIGGPGTVAWPRFDHERIDVVADKVHYSVGETARLIVKSPFERATALLTVERSGVMTHKLIAIEGNTPVIEVPIEARFAPNVFASVVVIRGRIHGDKDATGYETGAPAFRMGYVQLSVDTAARAMSVSAAPDRAIAGPGESLTVKIQTNAPNAQATVAVVDEAVLAMTRYATPNPLAELMPARGLSIRTAETRLDLPFSRRERRERIFPSGDGGDGFALSTMPDELRKLMKSTAYWNPRVQLDSTGSAKLTFQLPDNLTTYRIMVIGYDQAGRAGSTDAKVQVRKALMAQPVLPRFARAGDTFRVEMRVFDGSGVGGQVDGRFALEGLELDKREADRADRTFAGRTRLEQRAELPEKGSVTFEIPVVVTGRGSAKVSFAAVRGSDKDAVETTLPILATGAERKLVITKTVRGSDSIELPLPGGRVPGTTKVELLASSTSLGELKDSVEYLMGYPNGCIEQTTSTAYPLVMLKDLLPEMGITVNEQDLQKYSTAGVERILSFQTAAGGLSYWPGGTEPHAFATAFGLTALLEAKKRGYDVPSEKLAKMADFLEATLARGTVTESIPHGSIADGDTRALFVMTLGRLGRPQPSWISTLWREHAKLTPFGLGFLAVAIEESQGDKSLLPAVLAEIRKADKENETEAYYELARKGGYSMDSPLRSHATALLAFAGSEDGEASGKLLRGLLNRKNGYGIWGNTQENVFGIMAVAKMTAPTAPGSGPELTLKLDGKPLPQPAPTSKSARTHRLELDPRLLTDANAKTYHLELASKSALPMNVTLRAQYEASLELPENRAAYANGFSIRRTVTTLDGKPIDEQLPLGTLVRVALDVETSSTRNYVAVSDPLPAGLEALNASLDTTEKVSLGEATEAVTNGLARLSYSEVRDARVAFFADELPAGSYRWVYVARATTKGRYLRPAAKVEQMYEESVAAGTSVGYFEVR